VESYDFTFARLLHVQNLDQQNFYPYIQHLISIQNEFCLRHLCYCLTDVPPQPNSLPESVLELHPIYFLNFGFYPKLVRRRQK